MSRYTCRNLLEVSSFLYRKEDASQNEFSGQVLCSSEKDRRTQQVAKILSIERIFLIYWHSVHFLPFRISEKQYSDTSWDSVGVRDNHHRWSGALDGRHMYVPSHDMRREPFEVSNSLVRDHFRSVSIEYSYPLIPTEWSQKFMIVTQLGRIPSRSWWLECSLYWHFPVNNRDSSYSYNTRLLPSARVRVDSSWVLLHLIGPHNSMTSIIRVFLYLYRAFHRYCSIILVI